MAYKGVKPRVYICRKWVGLIEEVRRVHEGVPQGECDVASHLIRKCDGEVLTGLIERTGLLVDCETWSVGKR